MFKFTVTARYMPW